MKRITALLLLLIPAAAFPQAWSGVLAPSRAITWEGNVGVPGGIPSGSWSNCVTTQCNTVNGGTVTASSINAAIASAPANSVIRIPSGTFTLSGSAFSNGHNNFVLRGSGPTTTKIILNGNNILLGLGTAGQGGIPSGSLFATNLSTLTQGSTTLTVASSTGLSAGMVVQIDQLNDSNYVNIVGNEGTENAGRNGTSGFSGSTARAQLELVKILTVPDSTHITIDAPGLSHDYTSGLTPQVFWWATSGGSVSFNGIENMTVDAGDGSGGHAASDFAVSFDFCNYCWSKNLAVINGHRAAIYSLWSYKDEFRDGYISESNAAGAPTEYGFELDTTSLIKVENNIIFGTTSPVNLETSYGTVLGYNYALNTSAGNQFPTLDTHRVQNFLELSEGNTVATLAWDDIWGGGNANTFFRNRSSGNDPNKTNFQLPVAVAAWNRYANIVGNVLGDPTFHLNYTCDNAHAIGSNNFIYEVGFSNRCEIGTTDYDITTLTSLMRWGNWDSVTYCTNGGHSGTACGSTGSNGIRFCTASGAGNAACTADERGNSTGIFPVLSSPSTTLPASFYNGVTAAHASCGTGLSFWKNPSTGVCPQYPAIGPDVAGTLNVITNTATHATMIPAQLCYNNTAKTSGFLTAFDAAACYAADPPLTAPCTLYAGPKCNQNPTFVDCSGGCTNPTITPATPTAAGSLLVIVETSTKPITNIQGGGVWSPLNSSMLANSDNTQWVSIAFMLNAPAMSTINVTQAAWTGGLTFYEITGANAVDISCIQSLTTPLATTTSKSVSCSNSKANEMILAALGGAPNTPTISGPFNVDGTLTSNNSIFGSVFEASTGTYSFGGTWASGSGRPTIVMAGFYQNSTLPTAIAPIMSPGTGHYGTTRTVAMASPSVNGVIHYSTSGTPTCASTTYTAPITVSSNQTVKALTCNVAGYNNSPVTTNVYAITGITSAQTWYVRADGAGLYTTARATTGGSSGPFTGSAIGCDGLADAPYPGSGTNQHCAVNDFRYLFDPQTFNNSDPNTWLPQGGDTIKITGCATNAQNSGNTTAPQCRLGYDNNTGAGFGSTWCWGGGVNGCSNPPIPSGTAGQHTRILGQNFASCSANSSKTYVFGGFGLGAVLDLSGAQYVDVQCINLTRNGNCIQHGSPALPSDCGTPSSPVNDYASDGLHTSQSTHDVFLTDMWIHGFPDRGSKGAIGGLVRCTRCNIDTNGEAGWDFDDGSGAFPDIYGNFSGNGTPSVNGQWDFLGSTLQWSGCNQEYPFVSAIPVTSCYSQGTAGYGDAVGGPPGGSIAANIVGSQFLYNVQDALDLGHSDAGPTGAGYSDQTKAPLVITKSTAFGNGGGTWKAGPNASPVTILNTVAIGNCSVMSKPITGTPSSFNANLQDFCRSGSLLSLNYHSLGTITISNNTFVTYFGTAVLLQGWEGAYADPGTTLNFQNNLTYGLENAVPNITFPAGQDYGGNNGGIGGFFYNTGLNPAETVTTNNRTNNLWFGVRSENCSTFVTDVCSSPLFVNQPAPCLVSGGSGCTFTEQTWNVFNQPPRTDFNGLEVPGALGTWVACFLPSCNPGGSTPSGTPTVAVGSTALSPNSLIMTVGGNNANLLGYLHVPCPINDCTKVTAINWRESFYIPSSTTHLQALEFDPDLYSNNWRYFASMQCDSVTGKWRFWNMAGNSWTVLNSAGGTIPTYSCAGVLTTTNTKQTIYLETTFDQTAHTYTYNKLVVNGTTVYTGLGNTYSADAFVGTPTLNFEQQIDSNSTNTTNVVYYADIDANVFSGITTPSFNLTSSSPARTAGVSYSGIQSTDFNSNAQTTPPTDGAVVFATGATVVSIAVTPNPGAVTVSGTLAMTCTATYSDSSTAACTSPVWSDTNTHSSINTSTGVVTGASVGADTITAVASSFTSPGVTVNVSAAPTGSSFKTSGNFSATGTFKANQ